MELRIFTLPFDKDSEGFPDEIVREFCLNKKVHRLETQFFIQDRKPFWSVSVQYETLLPEQVPSRELDEVQRKLYERLRQWRKEVADKEGIPSYVICTNAHLIEMIRLKCQNLESFKLVRGFGVKRAKKYGKAIIDLMKIFYETRKQEKSSIESEEKSDLPF